MLDEAKTSKEALWLALKLVPRLSVQRKLELVRHYNIVDLFKLSSDNLKSIGLNVSQISALTRPNWSIISDIIMQTAQANAEIIYFDHPDYPCLLKEIYDPPLLLWVKGNVKVLSLPQVAMVGSRAATISGREFAFQLANELAQYLVVTSGLAMGIDAASHKGVLAAKGKTIAVVGTGIDKVYPARNKPLVKSIIEQHGAIVSEFLPGVTAKPGHFPRRNRIISGLSLGTVIVEAEIKSGSLITARCAIEHNREVFAVPGSPNNPLTKGCHRLIKEGAKLIDCVADIIEELDISVSPSLSPPSPEKNIKINEQDLLNEPLLASVDYEITPVDIVVYRSKLPTDEVLSRLMMLELKGLVSAVPGGYLRLNRG